MKAALRTKIIGGWNLFSEDLSKTGQDCCAVVEVWLENSHLFNDTFERSVVSSREFTLWSVVRSSRGLFSSQPTTRSRKDSSGNKRHPGSSRSCSEFVVNLGVIFLGTKHTTTGLDSVSVS